MLNFRTTNKNPHESIEHHVDLSNFRLIQSLQTLHQKVNYLLANHHSFFVLKAQILQIVFI